MNAAFERVRRVACIGEVMIELADDGQERPRLDVAGDTYNTAVYLKRGLANREVAVSYVTALGRDRFSARIGDALTRHRLDTSLVEIRADRVPGIYLIETSDTGERGFSYWRSQSAARTLFQPPCSVGLERLLDFDLVYLSGITLAILPVTIRKRLLYMLDRFRAQGGLVAYDSNHRPRLWESASAARAAHMAMWARADLALPSVDDETGLFGENDAAQVIARLNGAGARFGALKRGALGPMRLDGAPTGTEYEPVAKVVDTTAAGDSFNAGVLAALIGGQGLDAAMLAGHRLAATVIGARGAILPG